MEYLVQHEPPKLQVVGRAMIACKKRLLTQLLMLLKPGASQAGKLNR